LETPNESILVDLSEWKWYAEEELQPLG